MAKYPIPEIKVRISYRGAKKSELISISSGQDAAEFFRGMMSKDGHIHFVEEFYMLCLNQAHKCIGYYRVSYGGMTGTVADLRIIASIALNCVAVKIIVAHNHPSGNVQPSDADRQFTRKLKDGLALLDIVLLDHLIITDERYLSLQEEGYM
jgi:DNA repair protein RadC